MTDCENYPSSRDTKPHNASGAGSASISRRSQVRITRIDQVLSQLHLKKDANLTFEDAVGTFSVERMDYRHLSSSESRKAEYICNQHHSRVEIINASYSGYSTSAEETSCQIFHNLCQYHPDKSYDSRSTAN